MDPPPIEMVAGEAEGVEFRGEAMRVGEVRAFIARKPDQAAGLDRRQLGKVKVSLVEARECVRPGQAGEGAVQLIGPGVIGADQARRADRLGALDQPRAAMPADIVEDVRLPLLVASEQQRRAEPVMRHRHIRAGQQSRGRYHRRPTAEDPRLLRLEPRRIGINGGGNVGDAVAMPALAAGDQPGKGELPLGRMQAGRHVHGDESAPGPPRWQARSERTLPRAMSR